MVKKLDNINQKDKKQIDITKICDAENNDASYFADTKSKKKFKVDDIKKTKYKSPIFLDKKCKTDNKLVLQSKKKQKQKININNNTHKSYKKISHFFMFVVVYSILFLIIFFIYSGLKSFNLYTKTQIEYQKMHSQGLENIYSVGILDELFDDLKNIGIKYKNLENLNLEISDYVKIINIIKSINDIESNINHILFYIANNVVDNQFTTNNLNEIYPFYLDISLEINNIYDRLIALQDTEVLTIFEIDEKISQYIAILENFLFLDDYIQKHYDIFLNMLGHEKNMHYLILLQNNDEIRPTGGFIGSVISFDLYKGDIYNFDFTDIYLIDQYLKPEITSPEFMHQLNPSLFMRDANLYYDYNQSGYNINKFYNQATGQTADIIVFLNKSFVEKILNIIDGVKIIGIPIKIDGNNFRDVVSFYIEAKINQDGYKNYILQIYDQIIAQLDTENFIKILILFFQELYYEEIKFYAIDNNITEFINKYNLSNKNIDTTDYLHISRFSISGNKSDAYIQETITHDTNLIKNEIINTLHITRSHTFDSYEKSRLRNLYQNLGFDLTAYLEFIMGNGLNQCVFRIYLPQGAKLHTKYNIDDIKKYEENNKTVFEFQINTMPKETKEFEIQYSLPYQFEDQFFTYTFFFEKQSGMQNINFIKNFTLLKDYKLVDVYPYTHFDNYFTQYISSHLKTSMLYSYLIKKE